MKETLKPLRIERLGSETIVIIRPVEDGRFQIAVTPNEARWLIHRLTAMIDNDDFSHWTGIATEEDIREMAK